MTCPHCGAHSDIETPFCPYCGKEIPFFKQHREDMARYEEKIKITEETVVSENKRFSGRAAKITVLCVLIILVLVSILLNAAQSEIRESIMESRNHKNAEKHLATLKEYENSGNYEMISEYYRYHDLYYNARDEVYGEYEVLYYFCNNYKHAAQYLMDFRNAKDTEQKAGAIERFVSIYNEFLNCEERYLNQSGNSFCFYYESDACYNETHLESIKKMKSILHSLIITYFHVDADEISNFDNMSESRKSVYLEDLNL